MALIIAIVLIVILFGRVSYDKIGQKSVQVAIQREKDQQAALEAIYTNKALEKKISELLADSQQAEDVRSEVKLAYEQMGWHFSPIITYKDIPKNWSAKYQAEWIPKYDRTIRDILLANRGYVSDWAWYWGYRHSEYYGVFDLVYWIHQTLQKQGINLEPLYIYDRVTGRDKCVWKGSSEYYSERKNSDAQKCRFDKNCKAHPLYTKPSTHVDIPPPYYTKSDSAEQ